MESHDFGDEWEIRRNTKYGLLFLVLFSVSNAIFSQDQVVNVSVNLNKQDQGTLHITVSAPQGFLTNDLLFPKVIPGTYEIGNYGQYISSPRLMLEQGNTLKALRIGNMIKIRSGHVKSIRYSCRQSMPADGQVAPEQTIFRDSLFLLNWNSMVGYFQRMNPSYRITVTKPSYLYGETAMKKTVLNDTTDVYYAGSYTELIHSPVLYSLPDTCSFSTGDSNIFLDVYSTDPDFDSHKIKAMIEPAVKKCLAVSLHRPNDFHFIFLIDRFRMSDELIALEHPNCTVVCYPTMFNDSLELVKTAIHEFCHTLFSPLFIKSIRLSHFDYAHPKSDENLWFYEGANEYISQKLCMESGAIGITDFIGDLETSVLNSDRINLAEISRKVYSRKGQRYFDNFYTRGCLVSFLLDLHLCETSTQTPSLLALLNKLQKYRTTYGPFHENELISILSSLSGTDLSRFLKAYVDAVATIDFQEDLRRAGYEIKSEPYKVLGYSYGVPSVRIFYTKDRQPDYMLVRHSAVNEQTGIKKLRLKEVNGEPFDIQSIYDLEYPETASMAITYLDNGIEKSMIVKARTIGREKNRRIISRITPPGKINPFFFWRN